MGAKENMLKAARADLGVKESPAGSNRVKFTAWYGMVGPWCAMAVSYWANRAKIPTSVIPKHAYTPSGKAWFKARGQWGTKPRVGAIAYYNLSGLGRVSHVGVVEKVYSDGSFIAIEGNTDAAGGRTGGKVMRKRRKYMGVGGGFGYPKYDGKASSVSIGSGASSSGFTTVGYGTILRKGVEGAPVKDVQKAIGVKVDGQFGGDTEKALKAFQRKHGLVADGECGPATWKVVKKVLGYNPAAKAKEAAAAKKKAEAKKSSKLTVDGQMGPATKKALQRALKVTADGVIGKNTIKALQRKVGAAADGKWGRDTTKKLQKRLGVKADGAFGPNSIRALQKRLNTGKL